MIKMIKPETNASAVGDEETIFDSIPSVIFDNRTRFRAIHFNTVDQHDQAFHVFVAKQAFEIGAADGEGTSQLRATLRAAELEVEDRYFDLIDGGSVAYESDLVPFKPRCDVLVNGTACAPGCRPVSRFTIALKLQQGPDVLIDKKLAVLGEHCYRRLSKASQTAAMLTKASSLGMIQTVPWMATEPAPFTNLPIRYEFAIGGAVRIAQADPAAQAVPDDRLLKNSGAGDAAHEVCEANPLGRGFAPLWYLNATGTQELAAPRIVYADQQLSGAAFWAAVNGKALPRPAGLGVVGRAWLPRRHLVGSFVDKPSWTGNEIPRLPEDFDYGYWNCAPEDQQCSFLRYGEIFTLQNLFSADKRHAIVGGTTEGNTVVRFILPQQTFFLLAGNKSGEVRYVNLVIDTVCIDTDRNRIELVWRALIPANGQFSDVRLLHVDSAAQIERVDAAEALGVVRMKSAARQKG